MLTILSNPSSRTALTQLVGRILRQPSARKTHVAALDESYVFCFQRRGQDLLQEVRKGFGLEGLSGLEGRVVMESDGDTQSGDLISQEPRPRFRDAARGLVLPAFAIRDEGRWRLVYYEADILSRVPWHEVDATPLHDLELEAEAAGELELRAGLEDDIEVERVRTATQGGELDYYFAASHLVETVPNPWRGRELAASVFGKLVEKHGERRVAANYVFILEEIRKRVEAERDRLARGVFEELLREGVMRFMVVTEELGFNRPPPNIELRDGAVQANREDGSPYMRSLFDRNAEEELNGLENRVATYLDRQERLFFWYRNRPRKDYFVQGWRRSRIYADFVFALQGGEEGGGKAFSEVFVMETKGLHLKDAEDTGYKRSVFDVCSEQARKADWAELAPAMRDTVVRFEVVDEEEWERRLNGMFLE